MFQWYRLFLLLGIATLTNAWTITTIHHAERQRTTATHLHGQSPIQEGVDNHISNNHRLLIVGFGRVGQQVAQLASKQVAPKEEDSLFWNQIVGTVRDAEKAANVNDDNNGSTISCTPISHLQQELSSNYSHVLIAMPPNDVIYSTILCGIQNITWLGMVSTTGVYGNYDGGWVTEESALRCTDTSTASQYVEWEETFGQACQPVRIFRCAGIYDGTRSALHTLWKQAKQEDLSANGNNRVEFKTNRIHVEDIAQAIVHSMMSDSKSSFEIYNLADDLPERRSVVMEYAASLLTKKLGEDWKSKSVGSEKVVETVKNSNGNNTTKRETKSVRRRRRELEPKMIDNQKLKNTILPQLKYPSYKEGLDAILLEPKAPWNNLKED